MSELRITIGDPFNGPPVDQTCKHCDRRPATLWWSNEGGAWALSRGMFEARCEFCAVEEQLKHARELAATIPKLEAKMAELVAKDK